MTLKKERREKYLRKSDQFFAPLVKEESPIGKYDLYPSHKLETRHISTGIKSLIENIGDHHTLIIDGYVGVFFDKIREQIEAD